MLCRSDLGLHQPALLNGGADLGVLGLQPVLRVQHKQPVKLPLRQLPCEQRRLRQLHPPGEQCQFLFIHVTLVGSGLELGERRRWR